MRCPYSFLEPSTLRPWPVSFAVPGSLVCSSVGKLLVLHSGSSGGAPQCGLHIQSSTSEAFTGRRPWPVFQPAASQPTPFIRGSSLQNSSPSSHLDHLAGQIRGQVSVYRAWVGECKCQITTWRCITEKLLAQFSQTKSILASFVQLDHQAHRFPIFNSNIL